MPSYTTRGGCSARALPRSGCRKERRSKCRRPTGKSRPKRSCSITRAARQHVGGPPGDAPNKVVQHAPVLDNPVVPAAAQQMARDYQYNSIIAAPMIRHDTVVGAIVCGNPEPRVFDEKEVALIKSFAAQAVIAIENARLLTELRQRTDDLCRSVGELRALGEVSQAVNSTLDLETVLDTIVAKAVQLSNTDAGAIYVYGEQDSEFHLRATYGMAQELIDALSHARISVSEQNVNQMLTQRQPVHVADLSQGLRSPVDDIILSAGYRARLVAPLFRGDDIVCMLVVRRRAPGMFAPSTVDLMKTFASQSAVTIHNARLYESVEARTRELAASLHDLRTAQDRLIQTEKLASLGQLTAGIATRSRIRSTSSTISQLSRSNLSTNCGRRLVACTSIASYAQRSAR